MASGGGCDFPERAADFVDLGFRQRQARRQIESLAGELGRNREVEAAISPIAGEYGLFVDRDEERTGVDARVRGCIGGGLVFVGGGRGIVLLFIIVVIFFFSVVRS